MPVAEKKEQSKSDFLPKFQSMVNRLRIRRDSEGTSLVVMCKMRCSSNFQVCLDSVEGFQGFAACSQGRMVCTRTCVLRHRVVAMSE